MIPMNEHNNYANVALYSCEGCGGEFIVSCERVEKQKQNSLFAHTAALCGPTALLVPRIRPVKNSNLEISPSRNLNDIDMQRGCCFIE